MTTTRIDLDTPYPLTEAHRRRFREDGFITLGEVLSPEALAYHGGRIDALVAARDGRQPMAARSTYGKAFLQIMNLWTQDAVTRELVCSPRLARIAAELMGVAGVRLYHD